VTRVPVLLIEYLDGVGAAPEDGRLRAVALSRAGFTARMLAIAPPVPASSKGARGAPAGSAGEPVIAWRDGPAAVREALATRPFELAIVVSSMPGRDAIARWLPAQLPARWWPGGLAAAAPPLRLPWTAHRALSALGGQDGARVHENARGRDADRAALDWAVLDDGALARRHHPLWDGDYVLAPAPLAGESGEDLIRAFAAVARDHDALDLVVLAGSQPVFDRITRGLGVGMRVHFVGAATREAEWSWLKPAAAAVLAGPGPIAAGLVMRALACGCPILGAGADGVGHALDAWLVDHGVAFKHDGSTLASLTRILDRPADLAQAVERGRRESATHHVAPLGDRLSVALPEPAVRAITGPRRKAA
jgi:hypothetical protein